MKTFYIKETPTKKTFSDPQEVYESIKGLARADQESFWVIGYNIGRKEIFRKCLFIGGLNGVDLDPKIIFNRLLLHGVSLWIGVHNHPSGEAYPSLEDMGITSYLKQGSEILGLQMLDHIIIGDGGYYSFADLDWPSAAKERPKTSEQALEFAWGGPLRKIL